MLIQLAVEVAVASWLSVKVVPVGVAVTVVEGRMLTPWTPMPADTPLMVAQVTVLPFSTVPICAEMSVEPPPRRVPLKAALYAASEMPSW